MNSNPPTPPPPSSQAPHNPPPPPPPPRPQHHLVHVTAKRGGFSRAVGFVVGLFAFAAVFVIGMTFGLFTGSFTAAMESYLPESLYRDGSSATIAILPVEGGIDSGQAAFVHYAVDQILDDSRIRAVVLRVDSGGGGVTASDQIWNEIERLKKGRNGRSIPVIASYGSIAASGGYYVSCAADHIMAEETCITGSIGVIAQALTFGELFEKVGVEPVTLVATQSPEKDAANDTYRQWTEHDREVIQHMLDASYDIFHRRVWDGRNGRIESEGSLAELANGSIFTAAEAKENGLIDSIGYLDDAIALAEKQVRLAAGTSTVVRINRPLPSLADFLLGEAPSIERVEASWQEVISTLDADRLRSLLHDLSRPRAMYIMP